jgi:hypothetical protein
LDTPGVQTGEIGDMCVQVVPQYTFDLAKNGNFVVNKLLDSLFAWLAPIIFKGDEDCLFLDLYVPGSAIREPRSSRLPVASWYFGGAVSPNMYGICFKADLPSSVYLLQDAMFLLERLIFG